MTSDDVKIASLDDLYSTMPGSANPPGKGAEPSSPSSTATAPTEPAAPKEGDDDWKELTEPTTEEKAAAAKKEEDGKAGEKSAKAKEDDDAEPEPADIVGLKQALKATRQKAREAKAEAAKVKDYETRLAEETAKRAELDQAARQMWARLQQLDPNHQPQQPPDPLVDPVAAYQYQNQYLQQALQERDRAYQQEIYMAKLVPSQRFMRDKHQDYAEVEAIFAKTANEAKARGDGSLWDAIRQHEFPAEYAYKVGKEIQLREQISAAGSLDQYVNQLVESKVKELAPQPPPVPTVPTLNGGAAQAQQAQRPPPPPSLARVPSVTPRNPAKTFQGITPLADLYKN